MMVVLVASLSWAHPAVPQESTGRVPGHHLSLGLAAGLSVMVALEYAYDWPWVGVYVMPQFQFQWPLLFARAPFLGAADLGFRVHLGRWFSLGIGALAGLQQSGPSLGFSVTPAMLHLGERGQHTLWIYVPFNWQIFGDSFGTRVGSFLLTVFPMLGYRYSFF